MKKAQTILMAVVVLLALTASVSSCKKNENKAPVISLVEPEDNSTVTVGNEIHVEGTMTDDESLHEAAILVIKGTDTVLATYPTVHELTSYPFHVHADATTAGTYTVKVFAEDHDGAQTTVTRTVTAN
jgi:hypothetical protein